MKTKKLSIRQRMVAVFLYITVFVFICRSFNDDWSFLFDSNNQYNLLFVSGALLLIFGTYIAEPYFTKPVDVVTNSIAVVLALLSVKEKENFLGYWPLVIASLSLVIFSIIIIFLSHFPRIERVQKIFFKIIVKLGQSRLLFSVVYLLTIVSYFRDAPLEFSVFLTFWIVFVSQFIVEESIIWLSETFISYKEGDKNVLGEAIGCENPFLYKIEVDFLKHKKQETKKGSLVYLSLENSKGAVGIIINEKQLINKKWLTVYLLEKDNAPLKIDLKKQEFISGSNTIFSKDNAVYLLDFKELKESSSKALIEDNYLYKNRANFIGYVAEGSDINKVRFHSLLDSTSKKYGLLKEGTIMKTKICKNDVLYQIIDGKTYEEELEKHNIYGYLTGLAQKLGRYDEKKQELKIVKWLPSIYAPVFFDETIPAVKSALSVGKLPETKLEIVLKDIDSLVTHNTAILGILGIGKSCLTFELIKKTIENTDVKIICLDITNEYKRKLPKYLKQDLIKDDFKEESLKELKQNNKDGRPDDPTSWGNEDFYRQKIDEEIKNFFEDKNTRILLLNPDWHSVSKAGAQFKISHKIDLTVAEKTRIISERLFIYAKNYWEKLIDAERELNKARCLLVLEEAHSLIPEWNSTANSGDQSASNGTAKIILQGRKYGFGSFVVTQRTANISKSILNQCNTIFALRIFDDTGKQFLENYIGSDYSNTLPTLEERRAIVVGKALKLKQPVIIELNERDCIISKK